MMGGNAGRSGTGCREASGFAQVSDNAPTPAGALARDGIISGRVASILRRFAMVLIR
jgi:hypothetical protein